jgi:hypothetical protein
MRNRILYRQQDTHFGLDHNIDSLCATAFDFERLLEVFLQQNNTLAQRPTSFFTEELVRHFNLPYTFLYFFTLVFWHCGPFT